MRVTLKEELKKCKNSLKRMLNKRDKWIKEHPGQMCISASQIQWTADVTKGNAATFLRTGVCDDFAQNFESVLSHFLTIKHATCV